MANTSSNAEDRKLWPPPIEKHFIDVLAEERKGNMPQGVFKKWLWDFMANSKCKEFRKKGLDHYELLGQLFNTSIVTRFLQSSSAQPALNSDKEQELDERFLSAGVYVHLEADSGDDIEELATLVEQQSKCVENHIAQPEHSKGKKKGKTLGKMTEAIKRFTEVSKARLIANESRKQTGESFVGGDRFSIEKAVEVGDF
nr:hypothetical protein CFP56_56356 [Quercus suber]